MSLLHTDAHRTVDVAGDAPYTITIGSGLLDAAHAENSRRVGEVLRGRHALVVSDSHVAPLYADRVKALLHAAKPQMVLSCWVMPAGEQEKTLARFGECLDALAALGATRDAVVVALGGGVVGDLAGFAAACWMRGIDCIQLPTTLLSMVDSSVGGKTAVDLPQGKNLVGAFHPPRAVIADTTVLRTLPDRELRAGLAEVVKYGAIFDTHFLDWLHRHADALLARDDAALAEAIARSCEFKADVVARDPYERGHRALLNFGHTFGHAIEAEQGYAGTGRDALNHGEAVAVGMVIAARVSQRIGRLAKSDADRIEALVARASLPTAPPALGFDRWKTLLARDKKVASGTIRYVLLDAIGDAVISADVSDAALRDILR